MAKNRNCGRRRRRRRSSVYSNHHVVCVQGTIWSRRVYILFFKSSHSKRVLLLLALSSVVSSDSASNAFLASIVSIRMKVSLIATFHHDAVSFRKLGSSTYRGSPPPVWLAVPVVVVVSVTFLLFCDGCCGGC